MTVDDKTHMQYDLANYWIKQGKRGTFELATACGKTRIGCIILKHMVDNYGVRMAQIITPTEAIRDTVWVKEIIKWIGKEYLQYTNIQCINSVYKERNQTYQLVIADEFHNYMPEAEDFVIGAKEYVKFFTENKIEAILGLTPFVDNKRRPTIESIAPVLYTITIDEALRKGYISNFKIYNIPIKLTVEEQDEYDIVQEEYEKYEKKLGGSQYAYSNANSIIKGVRGKDFSTLSDRTKKLFGLSKAYMKRMNLRKNYLYASVSKIAACNRIVNAYPDKCIVFSASKEFANEFHKSRHNFEDTVPMHSGISKVIRRKSLIQFARDDLGLRVLSAVKAINEGLDVPKVKMSVLVSGTSKRLEFIQRLGRNLRLDGREAVLAQLYIPDTQDEVWMNNRIYGISKKRVVKLDSIDDFLAIVNNFDKWQKQTSSLIMS